MSQEAQLSYAKAKQIYLEIYNHPVTIAKFRELGLSEAEANALANRISADVTQYEGALETYRRDLGYGLALTLAGLIAWLVVPESAVTTAYTIKRFKWIGLLGLGMLYSWYKKRKIIKKYESIDAELIGTAV